MRKKRKINLSADTGRTVSDEEAAANPRGTVAVNAEPKWKIEHWRTYFNSLSLEVAEKVQEQFSENTDVFPNKPMVEKVLREVIEGKR